MLKPILVGTSLALASFSLPAVAQQPAPAQREIGAAQTLNLTAEEQYTVLQNVEKGSASGNSTMGLGALTEGAAVPTGVKTLKFSDTVVTKVTKLKNHSYFVADNKVAIVDSKGANIVAVLDQTSPAAK